MDSSVVRNSKLLQLVRKNWKSVVVVGLGLLFVQDIFGTHGVLAMHRSQKEAAQMRQQIKQLTDENCQLVERVKDLKSDPEAIEQIARENMGLARPGEYIFKLPQKPGEANVDTSSLELHADALQKCQQTSAKSPQ